jgi:hypothetical protein
MMAVGEALFLALVISSMVVFGAVIAWVSR